MRNYNFILSYDVIKFHHFIKNCNFILSSELIEYI